ncbi:uncharacterized protein LOC135926640 isoform X2 [Gordionus sp. m RMFG-2023]|uniref:uncharacterized protein LOC135926640 isoform X2 n=1 Tax=Gordionus sp. m RMFG-2023 TaxID=3053472 RepID=UPI0031FDEAE1
MNCHQIISGSANDGDFTFCNGNIDGYPFLVYGSGSEIIVLDKTFNQLQVISHGRTGNKNLVCLDCSKENGKIIASYGTVLLIIDPVHFNTLLPDSQKETNSQNQENNEPNTDSNDQKFIYIWQITQVIESGFWVSSLSLSLSNYFLAGGCGLSLWSYTNSSQSIQNNSSSEKDTSVEGMNAINSKFILGADAYESHDEAEDNINNINNSHNYNNELNESGCTWVKIWKTLSPNPINHVEFSPDGQYFATSSAEDPLIKIWFEMKTNERKANPSQDEVLETDQGHQSNKLDFFYTYLYHPKPVLSFQWRQTSHYMPRGTVPNVLITCCTDNIVRIWREECTIKSTGALITKNPSLPPFKNDQKYKTFSNFSRYSMQQDTPNNFDINNPTANDGRNTTPNDLDPNIANGNEGGVQDHHHQNQYKFRLLKHLRYIRQKIHSIELCHLPNGNVRLKKKRLKDDPNFNNSANKSINKGNTFSLSSFGQSSFSNFLNLTHWPSFSSNHPHEQTETKNLGNDNTDNKGDNFDGVKFQFNLVAKLDNIDKDFSAFLTLHWLNNKEFHFTLRSEKILLMLMKHSKSDHNISRILSSYEDNIKNLSTSSSFESKDTLSHTINNPPNGLKNDYLHNNPTLHHTQSSSHVPDIQLSHSSPHVPDLQFTHSSDKTSSTANSPADNVIDKETDRTDEIFSILENQVIKEIEALLKDWHQNIDILYSIHPFNGDLLLWKVEWIDEYLPGYVQHPKLSFMFDLPNTFALSKLDLEKGFKQRHLLFTDHSLLLMDVLSHQFSKKLANSPSLPLPNIPFNVNHQVSSIHHDYGGIHLETENWSRDYFDTFPLYCVTNNKRGNLNLWLMNYVSKEYEMPRILNVEHICEVLGHTQTITNLCSHPSLPLILSSSDCEIIVWKLKPIGPLGISGGLSEFASKRISFNNQTNNLDKGGLKGNIYNNETTFDYKKRNGNKNRCFAWIPSFSSPFSSFTSTCNGKQQIMASNSIKIGFVALNPFGNSIQMFQLAFPTLTKNSSGGAKETSYIRRKSSTIHSAVMTKMAQRFSQSSQNYLSDSINYDSKWLNTANMISISEIDFGRYVKNMQGYSVKFLHVFDGKMLFQTSSFALPSSKCNNIIFYLVLILTNDLNLQQEDSYNEKTTTSDNNHFVNETSEHLERDEEVENDSDKIITWSINFPVSTMTSVSSSDENGKASSQPQIKLVSVQNIYTETQIDPKLVFSLPNYINIVSASPYVNSLASKNLTNPSDFADSMESSKNKKSNESKENEKNDRAFMLPPYLVCLACSDATIRFLKCFKDKDSYLWREWSMPHMYRIIPDTNKENIRGHVAERRGTSAIKLELPALQVTCSSFPGGRICAIVPEGNQFLGIGTHSFLKFKALIFECESSGGSDWILEDKIPLILYTINTETKNDNTQDQDNEESQFDQFYENPSSHVRVEWVPTEDGSHLLFISTSLPTYRPLNSDLSIKQSTQQLSREKLSVYAYFSQDNNATSSSISSGAFTKSLENPSLLADRKWRLVFQGITEPGIQYGSSDAHNYKMIPTIDDNSSSYVIPRLCSAWVREGAFVVSRDHALLVFSHWANTTGSTMADFNEFNPASKLSNAKDAERSKSLSFQAIQHQGIKARSSEPSLDTLASPSIDKKTVSKRKKSSLLNLASHRNSSAASGLSKLGSRSNLPILNVKIKDVQSENRSNNSDKDTINLKNSFKIPGPFTPPSLNNTTILANPLKIMQHHYHKNNPETFKILEEDFTFSKLQNQNNGLESLFGGNVLPQYHPKQLTELLGCGQIETVVLVLGYLTRFLGLSDRASALAASRSKMEHVSLQGTRNRAASMALSRNDFSNSEISSSKMAGLVKHDIFYRLPDISGDIGYFEVESIPPLPMFVFLTLDSTKLSGTSSSSMAYIQEIRRQLSGSPDTDEESNVQISTSTKPRERSGSMLSIRSRSRSRSKSITLMNKRVGVDKVEPDGGAKIASRSSLGSGEDDLPKPTKTELDDSSPISSKETDDNSDHRISFGRKEVNILTRYLTRISLPEISALEQAQLLALADTVAWVIQKESNEIPKTIKNADNDKSLMNDDSFLTSNYEVEDRKNHTPVDGGNMEEDIVKNQEQDDKLDGPGLRYCIAMRQFNYLNLNSAAKKLSTSRNRTDIYKNKISTPLMKSSAFAWALHSGTQAACLRLIPAFQKGNFTWEEFRKYGCGWWLSDRSTLVNLIENIAKHSFQINKDPLDACLYFILLGKKTVIQGLFKSSQNSKMYEFFRQDFTQLKWRRAADKNAFALLGKHKYHLAVAFFLLGHSLNDAIQVCLKYLKDIQLALIICKLYIEESQKDPNIDQTSEPYSPRASLIPTSDTTDNFENIAKKPGSLIGFGRKVGTSSSNDDNNPLIANFDIDAKNENSQNKKAQHIYKPKPGSLIGFGRKPRSANVEDNFDGNNILNFSSKNLNPNMKNEQNIILNSNTERNKNSDQIKIDVKPDNQYSANACELRFVQFFLASDPLYSQLYPDSTSHLKLNDQQDLQKTILDLPPHSFELCEARQGDPFILSICLWISGQYLASLKIFLDTLAPPKERRNSAEAIKAYNQRLMEVDREGEKESNGEKQEKHHDDLETNDGEQERRHDDLPSAKDEKVAKKKGTVKFALSPEHSDQETEQVVNNIDINDVNNDKDSKSHSYPKDLFATFPRDSIPPLLSAKLTANGTNKNIFSRRRMSSITETREPPSSFFLSMDRMFDITSIFNFYQYLRKRIYSNKGSHTINPQERHLYFACAYTYIKIGCPILALEILNRLSFKNICELNEANSNNNTALPANDNSMSSDDVMMYQLKWTACLKIMGHEMLATFGNTTFFEADDIDYSTSDSSGEDDQSSTSETSGADDFSKIANRRDIPANKSAQRLWKKIEKKRENSCRVWLRFCIWLEKEIDALTKYCHIYNQKSKDMLLKTSFDLGRDGWLMENENILRTLHSFICLRKPVGILAYVKMQLSALLSKIDRDIRSKQTRMPDRNQLHASSVENVPILNEIPYLIDLFKQWNENDSYNSTSSQPDVDSEQLNENIKQDRSCLLPDETPFTLIRDSCKDIMISVLDSGFGTGSCLPPGPQNLGNTYNFGSDDYLKSSAANWNRLLATQDASHSLSLCLFQYLTPLNPVPQTFSANLMSLGNQTDIPPLADKSIDGNLNKKTNTHFNFDKRSVEDIKADIIDSVRSSIKSPNMPPISEGKVSKTLDFAKDSKNTLNTSFPPSIMIVSSTSLDRICNSEFDVILNFWWKYLYATKKGRPDKTANHIGLFKIIETENGDEEKILDDIVVMPSTDEHIDTTNWPCLSNPISNSTPDSALNTPSPNLINRNKAPLPSSYHHNINTQNILEGNQLMMHCSWKDLRLLLAECLLAIHASCFLTALTTFDACLLYRITCLKLDRSLWKKTFGYCVDAYLLTKSSATNEGEKLRGAQQTNSPIPPPRPTNNPIKAKIFVPPTKHIFARIFQKPSKEDSLPLDVLNYESDDSLDEDENETNVPDDNTSANDTQHIDPDSFAWTLIRLSCVRCALIEVGTFLVDVLGLNAGPESLPSHTNPRIHAYLCLLERWEKGLAKRLYEVYGNLDTLQLIGYVEGDNEVMACADQQKQGQEGMRKKNLSDKSHKTKINPLKHKMTATSSSDELEPETQTASKSVGKIMGLSAITKYKILLEPDHTPFRSNSRSIMPIKRLWLRLVRDERTHDLFVKFIFADKNRNLLPSVDITQMDGTKITDRKKLEQDLEITGNGFDTKYMAKGNILTHRHSTKNSTRTLLSESHSHQSSKVSESKVIFTVMQKEKEAIHCFTLKSKLSFDFHADTEGAKPSPFENYLEKGQNLDSHIGDDMEQFFETTQEYYFYPRKDILAIGTDKETQEMDIHQALNRPEWIADDLELDIMSSKRKLSRSEVDYLIVPNEIKLGLSGKTPNKNHLFSHPSQRHQFHMPKIHSTQMYKSPFPTCDNFGYIDHLNRIFFDSKCFPYNNLAYKRIMRSRYLTNIILKRNETGVRKMTSHPLHNFYLTGGLDGIVKVWKWGEPDCLAKLNDQPTSTGSSNTSNRVVGLRYSPQGNKLGAMHMDGRVVLYNSSLESYLHSEFSHWNYQCHNKSGVDFTFLGSCTLIATAGSSSPDNKNLCVYDTLMPERSSCVQSLSIPDDPLSSSHSQQTTNSAFLTGLEWSSLRGWILAVTTRKGYVILVDTRSPRNIVTSFHAHESPIKCLSIDPREEYMVTGSVEGNIKVWSMATILNSCPAISSLSLPSSQNGHHHTPSSILPLYTFNNEHIRSGAAIFKIAASASSKSSSVLNQGGVAQIYMDSRNRIYSCGSDGSLKVRKLPENDIYDFDEIFY